MRAHGQTSQADLFMPDGPDALLQPADAGSFELASLQSYDHFVVGFSGGKDSLAAVLHLLELGVPKERIELAHHLVDGRESPHLMDWPVTEAYCRAIAQHLGLPIYMSWKEGGFEREMLRHNAPTAPTWFETPEGFTLSSGGNSDKLGTRRKFPQLSASLTSRWCSGYLKISPFAASITGQCRFLRRRTLVITGERAQESPGRARYAVFEPHRTDARAGRLQRHVDHWRAVHDWSEQDVWAIIERWMIRPHPAYQAGWGRLSCAACIFGNKNQWSSVAQALPEQVQRIRAHEREFKLTIHRKLDVGTLIAQGTVYASATPDILAVARSTRYDLPVLMEPWALPAGAYGEFSGPP